MSGVAGGGTPDAFSEGDQRPPAGRVAQAAVVEPAVLHVPGGRWRGGGGGNFPPGVLFDQGDDFMHAVGFPGAEIENTGEPARDHLVQRGEEIRVMEKILPGVAVPPERERPALRRSTDGVRDDPLPPAARP